MPAAKEVRRHPLVPVLWPRLDEHLAWVDELDRDLDSTVRDSELWRVDDDLLALVS